MSKQSFSLQTDDEVFHLDMQSSTSEFEDFIYLISHDVRNSVRALIELPQWIEEDLEEAGIAISGSVSQSIEMINTWQRHQDLHSCNRWQLLWSVIRPASCPVRVKR